MGGFGFHPLLAYLDETSEALVGELRPGNAGANTATDQIAVAEHALEQIPTEHVADVDILLRTDSAGASHDLLDSRREGDPLLGRLPADRARQGGDPRTERGILAAGA